MSRMRSESAPFGFVIVGFALALGGCGGKSHSEQTQLGNEAGSSNNGGANSAGSNAGGAGSNAGGASAGGQAAICASFVDAKPLSVPVLIRNDLTFAIHLGPRMNQCAETPLFLVQDASGTLLSGPGSCRTPCESLLSGDPVGGCIATCPQLKAVTLAPGESVSIAWTGLFGIQSDLPAECVPKRSDGLVFGTQCERAQAIAPGSYTFSAQAGTTLDCSMLVPGGCDPCAPGADGGCTTPYAVVGGPTLTAQSVVEIEPAIAQNDAVTLVFKD
jgi:hypothetical protein